MNLFVTGAAGFIGSKIAELLLKRGDNVIAVDNLNDAYDVRLKEWRLSQLRQFENFSFYNKDIVNRSSMESLFKEIMTKHGQIEAIINLAARAGVRVSVENPWVYVDTNVVGTLNLLELCRKHKIKKFILASTSSLYGNNTLPFSEDKKTDLPLSPYAASKKGAEALCYTYHYLYGIDVSIPRFFTVYGPAGRPDMSIFIFVKKIYNGEEMPVFGDGKQSRDFTYVDDIAKGAIKMLKPVGYQIVNLGNNHPVGLDYVIGLIEEALGKKAKIKYLPRHPADVTATWAEIKKAGELFEWKPEINIEEGIKRTVEWFRINWHWVKDIKV
ncbi:SDR family NAD(P)-dependent oxidoreductase [bacterium]|nr:SDR family NAD(P)-dependent oxidoreductase [bacterium]